jgi:hypothetical protein
MAIPKTKPKSLTLQVLWLRKRFPDARCCVIRNKLTFEADLKPSPTSDIYRVRLTYALGRRPKPVIVSPELRPTDGCQVPHTYDGQELCLHVKGEWKPEELLADTIVPWISEWIVNYETWVFTGDWLGGGTHAARWNRSAADTGS